MPDAREDPRFFFFVTLVTGPRRSLRLKLSDTRVYEPQIRARLGTTAHFCETVNDDPARLVQEIACPGDRALEGLFPPDAFTEDARVNANLYVPPKRHSPRNNTFLTKCEAVPRRARI